MGGGLYSIGADGHYDKSIRLSRAVADGFYSKPPSEVFKERSVNNAMNPNGVKIRESRDSKEHPNSLAIILALDVTGSMGSIPVHLIKDGLPTVMEGIIEGGIKDPQVLFLGIGDHECDSAPLQVGQFESSDKLLDHWLTKLWLEGGGGANLGESYLLAWYFAAKHTSIDCWEKRKQKGFLFSIGDEPFLKSVPQSALQEIMGDGQYDARAEASALLDEARKTYNVYHILIKQGSAGSRAHTFEQWKQLLGDNLLVCEDHMDVPKIIANTINKNVSTPTASGAGVKTDEKIIL